MVVCDKCKQPCIKHYTWMGVLYCDPCYEDKIRRESTDYIYYAPSDMLARVEKQQKTRSPWLRYTVAK